MFMLYGLDNTSSVNVWSNAGLFYSLHYTIKMFTRDLAGGNLRRKMKMRVQLKIRRCNVITLRN